MDRGKLRFRFEGGVYCAEVFFQKTRAALLMKRLEMGRGRRSYRDPWQSHHSHSHEGVGAYGAALLVQGTILR
jgi:hypothetical protein